jgi:hypothetical protein
MIDKEFVIEIVFTDHNRANLTLKGIAGFDVMKQGWFYVQTKDEFEDQGPDKNDKKVVVKWKRHWFPRDAVQSITMNEKVTFDGELEVLKYRKFKELGIDTAHQAVSYTAPPDPAKVAKKVQEDKFIQILEAKKKREENAN